MKIKTYIQVLLVVGSFVFGASLKAQSSIVSVGTYDGYSSLEVDFRAYDNWGSWPWGSFTLYEDNQAIFVADLGGPTYCASGLSYYIDYYGYYHFYGLNGDVSIQLSGSYGSSYSYNSNEIQFIDNAGAWLYLDWYP